MCRALEEMCAESFQAGMQKAIQMGIQKERNETVKRLLLFGMSPEKIAGILELPIEQVFAIQQRMELQ